MVKTVKLALSSALAALLGGHAAMADDLSSLKAQMDALSVQPAYDEAVPDTIITWSGHVQAGVRVLQTAKSAYYWYAPIYPVDAVDIITSTRLEVKASTQTAVGEIGAVFAIKNENAAPNGSAIFNANKQMVQIDDLYGTWKATPTFTFSGGLLPNLSSSYSWNANSGTLDKMWNDGIFGSLSGNENPAALRVSYEDGPLVFGFQLEDSNNFNNTSAFGASGRIAYQGDAFAIDLSAIYTGSAYDYSTYYYSNTPGTGITLGMKYSTDLFEVGGAIGTGQVWANPYYAIQTVGSAYGKLRISDNAIVIAGAQHDFSSDLNDLNVGATLGGAGFYLTPVKQFTVGLEGAYVFDGGLYRFGFGHGDTGSYRASLITQFSF